MRILIVEDDKTLNNGIALSFSTEQTVSAYTLKEAGDLLDGTIDLMILDINLPDGSGLDLLIDRIWSGQAEFVEGNALSVTVKRLREKLPNAPIRTVYGIGYVWEKSV